MKSTGEVLGLASTREEALYKGLVAAGYTLQQIRRRIHHRPRQRQIRDRRNREEILRPRLRLSTRPRGTAKIIEDYGMKVKLVDKIHEGENNTHEAHRVRLDRLCHLHLREGKNPDPRLGQDPPQGGRARHTVPHLNRYRERGRRLPEKPLFTGVHRACRHQPYALRKADSSSSRRWTACGNDYIYFDCFNQKIDNPEGTFDQARPTVISASAETASS